MEAAPGQGHAMETSPSDLEAHVRLHPDNADLQLSAFAAALQHHRRATIATPFPSHLFKSPTGEKDFQGCMQALEQLAPVPDLSQPSRLQALPQPSRALLAWLLLPQTRKQLLLHPVSASAFTQQLQQVQPGVAPPAFEAHQAPNAIFALDRPSTSTASRPVIAYHGTAMENLHSILNTGLLNVSGTRLQRTGAAFGNGIYLSTRHSVAYAFSLSTETWNQSTIGSKMRCLLVCEVDMDKVDEDGSSVPEGTPRASSGGDGLPEAYLLVSRTDAIRLLHVLIFCDAPPKAALQATPLGAHHRPRPRINWCTALVLVYALGIAINGLLANKTVQLQLRMLWRRLYQNLGA